MSLTKLGALKKDIENTLNLFFDKKLTEAKLVSEISYQAISILKAYTMRGGKRIRAILLYLGYTSFSEPTKEVLKACASMELLQSFLLIHDDIMDQDELRRGKPTVHVQYEKSVDSKVSKHYGTSMAICLGDLAFVYANELLLSANLQNKEEALKKMHEILNGVVEGQMLDLSFEHLDLVTEKDVLLMQELKTATYTIEGPLSIGALLAGASNNDIEIIKEFSSPLGLAFQLRDDILGLFGNEDKLGKPIGSDLKENKRTLLILKTLDKANNDQKKLINQSLGNQNITKNDIDMVRKIVIDTGSLKYSQTLEKELTKKALKLIKGSNLKQKEFLITLISSLSKRIK
tara:strand:+ start:4408 stop:5445 length:1038 start_codon:yes stop_codon:yes gene_type:complete